MTSHQLEKRHLSTVHLNCITRLYGEFAAEILELLRKNPVGAIPVILKRLKQKDLEWRRARQELTRTWKEVLATNTERSLDQRSFYHKSQDKRTYNAKHLVNDIKLVGMNADAACPPELAPLRVRLADTVLCYAMLLLCYTTAMLCYCYTTDILY
jgi:histone deacetylase complex regulatory component SIN3